jgi:hypothetical protein
MRRVRTIVPHCKVDAPIINAFQCSQCEWSSVMRRPKPYTISYEDAVRACREFDYHRCDDFKLREGGAVKVTASCICTGEGSLKAKNTRRDPRVSLSIVGNGLPVYLCEMESMYLRSPSGRRSTTRPRSCASRYGSWKSAGSPGLFASADYTLMKLPHVADVSTHRWQRSSM